MSAWRMNVGESMSGAHPDWVTVWCAVVRLLAPTQTPRSLASRLLQVPPLQLGNAPKQRLWAALVQSRQCQLEMAGPLHAPTNMPSGTYLGK